MEQVFPFGLNSFLKYFFLSLFLVFIDLIFPLKLIKETSFTLMAPLTLGVERAAEDFKEIVEIIKDLGLIVEENKELKEELVELKGELVKLNNVKNENDFLREELKVKKEEELSYLLAEVRGWQMDSFGRRIILNKGEVDGLEVGMPVVVKDYLVGKIVEVGERSAQVEVITSAQSSIPAMIFRKEGEDKILGIADGEFGVGLKLKQISQDAQIEEKDLVVTSGKGGTLPARLILGEVRECFQGQNEVYKQAKVAPLVSFEELERVLVILKTEF